MGSVKEMGKTIGEVERITGIPKREIKYCIEQRLIRPGKKSESGYWLYDEQEIEKLQMVVLFRRLEYPNDVIRTLISAPHIHWEQELRRQVTRLEVKYRRTEIQLTTAKWLLENLAVGQMDFDLIARALHMYEEIQD